jgi:hypothetical protein
MSFGHIARRAGTRAVTRRLIRSWPVLGGVIAALGIAGAIRRKGLIGGTVDTALNAVPFVGVVKNIVEARRGRDFIPLRPVYRAR